MRIRVCFSSRPDYDKVSIALYLALKEVNPGVEGYFVCNNEFDRKKMIKTVEKERVYVISTYIKNMWPKLSEQTFRLYESKYSLKSMWSLVYTDRFLVSKDRHYVFKIVSGLFSFYESLFSTIDVDYYYDEPVSTMQSYVASIVSEKFKVKYVAQNPAKGWEDSRHYFVSDPFQYIDGFDNHYLDKEYDLDLEDKMREFLRDFEEKGKEPSTMKYVKSIPKLDIKWLLAGFFFSCFPKYNDKNDYINYRGYRAFFDRFMFYFRYQIGKKYYSMPSLDRKYVYFPLHYQPEASTLVCASKYEKQLFYIDSLAKSLPGDTLLYVKEHYALLGSRKLKFYRELKQYPNVILVNPLVSSRKLIENAEVVVTLTGSAGWEAMLLRKPVIVSGNVFYENAPGVLKVQDIYMNYIDAIRSWRRPARSDIVKYLCEYYINSFDGSAYFPAKTNLNRVNMHEIAISLINYVSSHSELN